MMSKKKILSSRQESDPDHPIVQPVGNRYINWAITHKLYSISLVLYIKYYYDAEIKDRMGETFM
jgi:hypothetical protein